jgi:hypothetical protein
MQKILHEKNKVPGVRYALTTDGIEMPVVDVTHPAFALNISPDEQRELVAQFLKEELPLRKLAPPLRKLFFKFALRGSILAEGLGRAEGTYLSGMHTYLLKLGPKMLGAAYSNPVDRRIAASLPSLGVRLRVQDMARLMADALESALAANSQKPLRFVNIAGGPAIDSLNTLILLCQEHSDLLIGRTIEIDVLDLDEAGPAFGKAALVALSQNDAPLDGLRIGFRHTSYDWRKTAGLETVLREASEKNAIVICSSEGGLFEYGVDADVEANLRTLRASGNVLAVVGSVTRADAPMQKLRQMNTAKIIPRGLEVFRAIVEKSGWKITRVIERPFSDQVVLA